MESSQKRERDRRKRQKRKEKAERRKDRAETKKRGNEDAAGPGGASASTETTPDTAAPESSIIAPVVAADIRSTSP